MTTLLQWIATRDWLSAIVAGSIFTAYGWWIYTSLQLTHSHDNNSFD